jgi:hypothetical protein
VRAPALPAVLLAVLLALAALTACTDGSGSAIDKVADARRAQAERVARDAGLPAEVQRFLGRAATGVAHRFTVVYKTADRTTTLVQRPPQRRIDVEATTNHGETESVLRLNQGTFACRDDTTAPWTCRKQAAGAEGPDPDLGVFGPVQIADAVQTLAGAKHDYRFKVAPATIAKAKATCLVTTKPGAPPDEICISAEGAILRVRSATRTLEATSYRADADPARLRLPARPS